MFAFRVLLALSAGISSTLAIVCPPIMPQLCAPNEMTCDQGYDPLTGCWYGQTCQQNTMNYNCPERCPCPKGQKECTSPMLEGCGEDVCVQEYMWGGNPYYHPAPVPGAPKDGNCMVHCSSHCEHGNMKTCPLDYDDQGCPLPERCVMPEDECPMPLNDSQGCPIYDEYVDCGVHGMNQCTGLQDYRGCKAQDFCIPHGQECPEEQFNYGCSAQPKDPECGPNDFQCPGTPQYQPACPGDAYCIPKDATCQPICDMCAPEEQWCPGPEDETTGCEIEGGFCSFHMDWDTCPFYCPEHCPKDMVKCPEDYDHMGCKQPETCRGQLEDCPQPQYTQEGCYIQPKVEFNPKTEFFCSDVDIFTNCPKEYTMPLDPKCPGLCEADRYCQHDPDQLVCPQYDSQGCEMTASCIPPLWGYDGTTRCNVFCPTECPPDTTPCPRGPDENGCPQEDECVPLNGGMCANVCPVTNCGNGQICNQYDPETGCMMSSTCLPGSFTGPRNELCYPQCEPYPPKDSMPCPLTYDSNGCPMPQMFVPYNPDPKFDPLADCPISYVNSLGCPNLDLLPKCGTEEHMCYLAPDQFNCDMGYTCQHLSQPCEPQCNPLTEIACYGHPDPHPGFGPYDNRDSASWCMPKDYRSEKGRLCQNHCEEQCPPGTHSHQERMEDGCLSYPNCIPDTECPEEHLDSRGCPIPNEEDYSHMYHGTDCRPDQSVCYDNYDYNGCLLPDSCADGCQGCPVPEFDMNGCPTDVYEPCQPWEFECWAGKDHYTGCDMGHYCQPRAQGNCPQNCPVSCNNPETEQLCPSRYTDDEGCEWVNDYCHPINMPCYPENEGMPAGK